MCFFLSGKKISKARQVRREKGSAAALNSLLPLSSAKK